MRTSRPEIVPAHQYRWVQVGRSGFRGRRLSALAVGMVLLVAACSAGSGETDGAETGQIAEGGGSSDDQPTGDGEAQPPALSDGVPDPGFDYDAIDYDADPQGSALVGDRRNPLFPAPIIDPSLIRSGGVQPDVIPSVDRPVFQSAGEVEFLTDEEAVISVEVDGEARAYPIQVLIWHEIVNDQFGDIPVSVTYCPLCNSALAFDRRIGDRVLDFGTTGELYQSALVMYDRQTESLWAHFTGRGIVGHYAGAQLDFIPAQTISFAQFRAAWPEGQVLTSDTGHLRRYGENPYPGYDFEGSDPIGNFFDGEPDRRELAKARIVGITDANGSVAVRFEDLRRQPVIPVTEAGRNLVVFHLPGLASPLNGQRVDNGDEVGQSGVFEAVAGDGTPLTFSAQGENFVDAETGTTWNILGQGLDGPLAGETLPAVNHLDTFWFAWATYRPETVVVGI